MLYIYPGVTLCLERYVVFVTHTVRVPVVRYDSFGMRVPFQNYVYKHTYMELTKVVVIDPVCGYTQFGKLLHVCARHSYVLIRNF